MVNIIEFALFCRVAGFLYVSDFISVKERRRKEEFDALFSCGCNIFLITVGNEVDLREDVKTVFDALFDDGVVRKRTCADEDAGNLGFRRNKVGNGRERLHSVFFLTFRASFGHSVNAENFYRTVVLLYKTGSSLAHRAETDYCYFHII